MTLYLVYGRGASCAGMRALAFNAVFNVTLLWQFVGVLFSPAKKGAPPRKDL